MKHPKWLEILSALMIGVVTFRVTTFLISVVFIGLQRFPFRIIAILHQWDTVLVPILSLCAAILASRWQENILKTKSLKVHYITFAVASIIAFLPFKFRVHARPVMCSPIQIAIEDDYPSETLDLLLNRYPDLINGRDIDWDHYCPLVSAALGNKTNVVELLIKQGADIDYAIERLQQYNADQEIAFVLKVANELK